MTAEFQEEVVRLVAARRGHFKLESGHHGDLWLDLELLCLRPVAMRQLAVELARGLANHNVEAVCGPLIEGAFVALVVAAELDVEFTYSERFAPVQNDALFPVKYRIPAALRSQLGGKRVAIVNDVINAGSAVRGTFADLLARGANPVALGALLMLGSSAADYATEKRVPLETLARLPNDLWLPANCPLCASGVPLESPAALRYEF